MCTETDCTHPSATEGTHRIGGTPITAFSEAVRETLNAYGVERDGVRLAHRGSDGWVGSPGGLLVPREHREEQNQAILAPGATHPVGAGNRAAHEEPDPYRLCFERDLDRIKYSGAFRRLAGKCQVFVAPRNDMLRTRLTHALEVAQVAVSVSNAVGLCTPLAEAIALGHDCGHGPGGHAAEDAFTPFLDGGYDHAVYGADVVLTPLNLCAETLDGIRNHSWKRPAPTTPEAEVVSWADRVAYVCHDWADALRAGIMRPGDLPAEVRDAAGSRQSSQLRFFITALIDGIDSSGRVGMRPETAAVLDAFRAFNYEHIYLREESQTQADRVIAVLTALVEYFSANPEHLPEVESGSVERPIPGSRAAAAEAVRYVSSMTDRYAFDLAVEVLGYDRDRLPRSV